MCDAGSLGYGVGVFWCELVGVVGYYCGGPHCGFLVIGRFGRL